MRAIGRDPVFIERAAGAEITDVDGNTYVDYVCSWGPMILGHAHPAVLEAVEEAAVHGGVHRFQDGRMGVSQQGRAPGAHQVNVLLPVSVGQVRALR